MRMASNASTLILPPALGHAAAFGTHRDSERSIPHSFDQMMTNSIKVRCQHAIYDHLIYLSSKVGSHPSEKPELALVT
jgi:hypothetical protein